jgi:hypothetical protein
MAQKANPTAGLLQLAEIEKTQGQLQIALLHAEETTAYTHSNPELALNLKKLQENLRLQIEDTLIKVAEEAGATA